MTKKLSLILAVLLMSALVFTGCGASQPAPAPAAPQDPAPADEKPQVKVGFIYVGPVGDGGFTYMHDQGRKYLEEQLKVPTVIKESVPEDQEVEKVMNDMIDQGANIIFATSFGYMDHVKK